MNQINRPNLPKLDSPSVTPANRQPSAPTKPATDDFIPKQANSSPSSAPITSQEEIVTTPSRPAPQERAIRIELDDEFEPDVTKIVEDVQFVDDKPGEQLLEEEEDIAQTYEGEEEKDPKRPPILDGMGIKSYEDDEIGDRIEHVNEDNSEGVISINDILIDLLKRGGSDLMLSANAKPAMRIRGEVEQIADYARLSGDDIKKLMYSIMTQEQRNTFETDWELDFAHEIVGYSRYRVNVLRQKKQVGAVMRAIPFEIKSVEELGLPDTVKSFAYYPRGLVLVTGPTGSGKSTTLAAIIDLVNRVRATHIVTIEDPVEFVHEHKKSIIDQREVLEDTKSFADALKHVLRQDPDIILLGEMRDLETISAAVTAAETGHLVFGTLHTQSAKETITRIIDVFPDGAKEQIRTQLAAGIRAIVCQQLLKRRGGGRVAALEILIANDAIRSLIREGKLHQVESAMETSKESGMQTLTSSLLDLVKSGKVEPLDAAEKAPNYEKFIEKLGGEAGIKRINSQNSGNGKLGSVI